MSITVTELIARVRQQADMENSQFVSDNEIIGYLDIANGNAYQAVVKANEAYFVVPATVAVTNGTGALPTDLYKLISVEANIQGQLVTLRKFNFQERNRYNTQSVMYTRYQYRYCIVGNNLMMKPENTTMSVTVWYVPEPDTLTSASTVDAPLSMWYEFLVYSAAAACLAKEQSDPSFCVAMANKAMTDIQEQVNNRDESSPEEVVNVYRQNLYFE